MHALRCWLVAPLILTACAAAPTKPAPSLAVVPVTGTVEKVCVECKEALLVDRSILRWDELTVRIQTPADQSGKRISVEMKVDSPTQRQKYQPGSTITFFATPAAIAQHRVQLAVENLGR